jgi:hypothetical protein
LAEPTLSSLGEADPASPLEVLARRGGDGKELRVASNPVACWQHVITIQTNSHILPPTWRGLIGLDIVFMVSSCFEFKVVAFVRVL